MRACVRQPLLNYVFQNTASEGSLASCCSQFTSKQQKRDMQHLAKSTALLLKPHVSSKLKSLFLCPFSTTNSTTDDAWNDAWETAWLPDDTTTSSPWDSTNISPSTTSADAETAAFVADMNDNWEERRKKKEREKVQAQEEKRGKKGEGDGDGGSLYKVENLKRDYRLKKQRVHAGLWLKEIQKLQEAQLGASGDDIEKLLDSCSEIFESSNNDLNSHKVPSTSEFKNRPDGWETTTKSEDGSVWEMSQREEDILLQEFERRMAFCKFQIASFIKTHIFSRRRPIDGWKYMIEVIGPNAKKGKGSVSRLPSLADPATQPFTEERAPVSGGRFTSSRGR